MDTNGNTTLYCSRSFNDTPRWTFRDKIDGTIYYNSHYCIQSITFPKINHLNNLEVVCYRILHTFPRRFPIDSTSVHLNVSMSQDFNFHCQSYHSFNSCLTKDFLIAINLCSCFGLSLRVFASFSIDLTRLVFLGCGLC